MGRKHTRNWTARVSLALLGALLAGGCQPASQEISTEPAKEATTTARSISANREEGPREGQARAILNAGVMGELGGAGTPVKFLFDPLYDDHFGSLEELPDDLIETIVAGDPPYDGVSLVFVSHAHGDHFSARHLSRMMTAQPNLRMIAPAQALEKLKEAAEWEAAFEERVTAITLENGDEARRLILAGAEIEAFRSPHSGWPDRHAGVHNLTFRVTVPASNGRALRVMHVGDADPDPVHFEPHQAFLSRVRTGLVIVPFWFARGEKTPEVTKSLFNADDAVAVHIPQKEPEWLSRSEWSRFTEEGQTLPVGSAP